MVYYCNHCSCKRGLNLFSNLKPQSQARRKIYSRFKKIVTLINKLILHGPSIKQFWRFFSNQQRLLILRPCRFSRWLPALIFDQKVSGIKNFGGMLNTHQISWIVRRDWSLLIFWPCFGATRHHLYYIILFDILNSNCVSKTSFQ